MLGFVSKSITFVSLLIIPFFKKAKEMDFTNIYHLGFCLNNNAIMGSEHIGKHLVYIMPSTFTLPTITVRTILY